LKKKCVLIVEDEPIILLSASDMVEEAGFQPILARNAQEAIDILESRDDIRIIFTDIDMPGSMDGMKLAAAVRNRWPPIEIIVTSGHKNISQSDLPERGLFFRKPYGSQKVTQAMQRLTACCSSSG